MGESDTVQIFTAGFALIGTLITAFLTYSIAKLAKDQKNGNAAITKVHTIVNGGMRVVLFANLTIARRLADVTKDPVDVAAAAVAEKLLTDHDITLNK